MQIQPNDSLRHIEWFDKVTKFNEEQTFGFTKRIGICHKDRKYSSHPSPSNVYARDLYIGIGPVTSMTPGQIKFSN